MNAAIIKTFSVFIVVFLLMTFVLYRFIYEPELYAFILGVLAAAIAARQFNFFGSKLIGQAITDSVFPPSPPPKDEHPGWGAYVITYQPGLWQDNAAKVQDIVKGLGSKYKLDVGNVDYWSPKLKTFDPVEWIDDLERANKGYHFDGHLYIGGQLYWDGKGHILTVGQSQVAGKTSRLVVPALASTTNAFPGAPSYIVLDPKGEILAITGRYLRKAGYNVVTINPFNIAEIAQFGSSSFNVFDLFTADDQEFEQYADMITSALIPENSGKNDFWDRSARNTINLYIRHLMTQDEEPKNFTTLWRWLIMADEERSNLFEKMVVSDAFDGDISREVLSIQGQVSKGGGREVESIYATVRAYIDIFKDRQLRESISGTDFDLTQIAHQKTAFFVCMNPGDLGRSQAWLRILFGSIMRALTRHYSKDRKVVMIMDEFIQMGRLKEFEVFSNYAAGIGAGITLWPIVQSLGDLKDVYPTSWEKFVNNSVIKHFMKVGDNFTAEYVSKRMPVVDKGTDERPIREPLMRPDQIMAYENIIALIGNVQKPAFFHRIPYYEIPNIQNNVDPNPFY